MNDGVAVSVSLLAHTPPGAIACRTVIRWSSTTRIERGLNATRVRLTMHWLFGVNRGKTR